MGELRQIRPARPDIPQDRHIRETPLGVGFDALSQFSAATENQRVLLTLWPAHTYVFRRFPVTPRLFCTGKDAGCGKTINMQVPVMMSREPKTFGYASQASVYRRLQKLPGATTGLDETDKIFGRDGRRQSRPILAAVINDGYQAKGTVSVMDARQQIDIDVFAPLACAGIGTSLPDDTLTRCIIIMLEKGMPGEAYLPPVHDPMLRAIGGEMKEWLTTEDAAMAMRESPLMAEGVKGDPRFRLILAPLAAVARYAGCHDQFLRAVKELQTGIKDEPIVPLHEKLLADLRLHWPDDTRILPASLAIMLLHSVPESEWGIIPEGQAGQKFLASLLRQAGIETKSRYGERGYRRSDVFKVPAPVRDDEEE